MLPNCRITCSNARIFVRFAREEQVAMLRCAHFCQNRARRTNCQECNVVRQLVVWSFCHRSAGSGQRPGARRAFNRAPRSACAGAAGSRILRRRCPAAPVPCCSGALLLRCPAAPLPCCLRLLRLPSVPQNMPFWAPDPGNTPSVPQNMPFWVPDPGDTPFRTPKHAILDTQPWEYSATVGQNSHFCPSAPRPRAGSLGPQQKWGRSCN